MGILLDVKLLILDLQDLFKKITMLKHTVVHRDIWHLKLLVILIMVYQLIYGHWQFCSFLCYLHNILSEVIKLD